MHDSIIAEERAWLESLQARGFSPATVRVRAESLRAFRRFLEEAGIGRCQDVGVAALEDWRRRMLERRLCLQTVEQRLRSVRLFFDFLEARGLLFENPARLIRLHVQPAPLPRVPTVAQVLATLAQPDTATAIGVRDRALLELMYGTGMRLEEVARLEMADLDLDTQTVLVHGKGGRERLLPLGRSCLEWLRKYLTAARSSLLGKERDVARVWIGGTGSGPLMKHGVACRVKRHMCAAGLPPCFTTHALRRAAATHMLANGASPFAVRELLGHASMRHLSQYLRVSVLELRRMHRASILGR